MLFLCHCSFNSRVLTWLLFVKFARIVQQINLLSRGDCTIIQQEGESYKGWKGGNVGDAAPANGTAPGGEGVKNTKIK